MAQDNPTHNIFDEQPAVPVVIYVHGERRVIGEATIEQGTDGVNARVHLNSDDPQTAAIFMQGLSGLSIGADEPDGLTENPDPHSIAKHQHKAYDHDDGLTDHCDICGLTAGFMRPRPRDWRYRNLNLDG